MNPLIRILALVFGPLLAVASVGAGAQPSAPRVVLSTSEGDITLELNAAKAPKTVENFLAYVKSGHYDGTIFHRVIDGFMIQGGGFTPDMKQKPTKAPIALESRNGLKNERGTIAMARTSVPDSATSQFFINVVDNPRLDYPNPDGHGYAVFGRVVAGMDVVDRIRAVPTTSIAGHQNVPAKPVLIRSARIAP
jgi:peptidyl-prolyl cis-trans isomerase A (cyclophilin A)